MAYDTVRDRLLLVESGLPAGPQRVWTTTPDGWAIVGDPGPPGRELEAVTFDPTRGVLLLHGGMRSAICGPGMDDAGLAGRRPGRPPVRITEWRSTRGAA
jgi:hypothetical protein